MVLDAEHRPLVSADAFFVHVRQPAYRMVLKADAHFPSGTGEAESTRTRVRETPDVNAEVREAVDRDGCTLFRIGLKLSEMPKNCLEPVPLARVVAAKREHEEETMGRGILLWLLGVPIPVIILLWLFFGH